MGTQTSNIHIMLHIVQFHGNTDHVHIMFVNVLHIFNPNVDKSNTTVAMYSRDFVIDVRSNHGKPGGIHGIVV